MTAPKRAPEDPVKRSDEETQDEIEQIMSEIEQLQKEIGQSEPVAQPTAKKHSEERAKPHLVKSEPVTDGPEIESSFTETDPLEEFRAGGGGDDGGMEDTIVHIRGEESSGGALDEVDSEPELGDHEEDEIPETARETREAIARASREVEEAFEEDTHDHQTEEEHGMNDHDQAGKGGDGALTMTLKGNMTLRLQYEIEGQTVTIGFADNALKVQLADGTEFKIPMRHRAPVRRTA